MRHQILHRNRGNEKQWLKIREELKENECLLHWKRWKHVWNDVYMIFFTRLLWWLYIMNTEFIEWFHYISFFISFYFFNTSSSLRSPPFLSWIVDSFLSTALKPYLSVAVQMWTMRSLRFLHWMELLWVWQKHTHKHIVCVFDECVCVSVGIFVCLCVLNLWNTLSLFFCANSAFCIWFTTHLLHFKMQSNSNCVFLVVHQSIYHAIFRV